MFPVILYWLFGSVVGCLFKRCVNGVRGLLGWSCPVTCKKKKNKISHWERRARAKAKVGTFRRRALAVALVVRCRRRPCQRPPILGHPACCKVWPEALPNFKMEPTRWKWKEKNVVVWTWLLLNSSHPPWRVFALEVTIFFICPDSWALCAITTIT